MTTPPTTPPADVRELCERLQTILSVGWTGGKDVQQGLTDAIAALRAEVERRDRNDKKISENIQKLHNRYQAEVTDLRARVAELERENSGLRNALDVGQENCDAIFDEKKKRIGALEVSLSATRARLAAVTASEQRLAEALYRTLHDPDYSDKQANEALAADAGTDTKEKT